MRREYLWFGGLALLVLVAGVVVWLRLPKPFARPAPSSKWTAATEEPDLRVWDAEAGVIRTMKFEAYIEGVVAGEMDPDWPLEALKAQAIAARTFAIERLERTGGAPEPHPGADVSTDPREFQAYSPEDVNARVKQAVAETRGLILTYARRPIRAWFHKDAGGRTAVPSEGLGVEAGDDVPYCASVRVPWTGPASDWTASFSLSELRAAALSAGRDPGPFSTVTLGQKGPSGRVMEIMLGATAVPAPELRLALGSDRMKSTLISSLTMEGDRVTMVGKGEGHGVGLAQWGAKALADQGRTAEEILEFFFRGVTLAKLWS